MTAKAEVVACVSRVFNFQLDFFKKIFFFYKWQFRKKDRTAEGQTSPCRKKNLALILAHAQHIQLQRKSSIEKPGRHKAPRKELRVWLPDEGSPVCSRIYLCMWILERISYCRFYMKELDSQQQFCIQHVGGFVLKSVRGPDFISLIWDRMFFGTC